MTDLSFLSLIVLVTFSSFVRNTWSFCPQYCLCDDNSLAVNCHSASKLMVVPIVLNPRIKSLSLNHNQIKDITMSFQFYNELTHLDLSRNLIGSLGTGNFESLKHLQTLNVSYNSIKAVESGVFGGLEGLELLDLSGNQIDRIEMESFWGLNGMRELFLDRNRLEFIDWEMFRGLASLQRISIQFNFIQIIEPSASLVSVGASGIWEIPSLLSLDVSSNQLTRVKDNSLAMFTSLRDLNLCCNYIHTLESNSLKGLNALNNLNLSQNRLGGIPTPVLQKVSLSLQHLDLSSNRLTASLDKDSFSRLFSLKSLRLNDHPSLESLHQDSMEDLVNLESFEGDYLSNLSQFSAHLLDNKPNLKRFSLRYAQIQTLPPELFTTVGVKSQELVLRTLDVSGNPIDCNCSILPLFEYLQKAGVDEQDGEISGYQQPQTGAILHDLNLSQAQYVDQSHSSRNKNPANNNHPFYISFVRCQSPSQLSGIMVKDLKSSDFSSCFNFGGSYGEDAFQYLVIFIGASLLVLIMMVLGIKLCCIGHNCRKSCEKFLSYASCSCLSSLKEKALEESMNFKGDGRIFEGRNLNAPKDVGETIPNFHNPPNTFLMDSEGGQLFFNIDGGILQQQQQPLFYNYNGATTGRKENTYRGGGRKGESPYSGCTEGGDQAISHHGRHKNINFTSLQRPSFSGSVHVPGPRARDNYHQNNYYEPDNYENEYDNGDCNEDGGVNGGVYDYENYCISGSEYPGYSSQRGKSAKKNKKHRRQGQVPSVLV